jgi:hypothetical protein
VLGIGREGAWEGGFFGWREVVCDVVWRRLEGFFVLVSVICGRHDGIVGISNPGIQFRCNDRGCWLRGCLVRLKKLFWNSAMERGEDLEDLEMAGTRPTRANYVRVQLGLQRRVK